MTVANDLFVRILAMDAYFRGADAPITAITGTSGIGNANFLGDRYLPITAPAEGFYAAAYTINGVTVISYRGTDDLPLELAYTDIPIAAGQWQDDSVLLAMHFYNNVASSPGTGPILLTGHSLGGGLAGVVASLTDRPAAP